MSEKCKITFVFETGKDTIADMYREYEDGTSIKGAGAEMTNFCYRCVEELINNPLTEKNKLIHIELN